MSDQNQALTTDDLNLVASLADATKDEEEIWNELELEESGGKADEEDLTEDQSDTPGEDQDDADAGEDHEEDNSSDQDDADEEDESEEVDIWASASVELRTAHEESLSEIRALEHRLNSDTGRVSALQRQVNDLRGQLEKAVAPQVPSGKTAVEAVNGLAEEYPELAGPLQKVVSTMQAQIDDVKSAENRRRAASDLDLAAKIEVETAAMDAEHPGYEKLIEDNAQAFVDWLNNQDDYTRNLFAQNQEHIVDAKAASHVVHGFKKHLQASAAPSDTAQDEQKAETQKEQQLSSKRQKQLEATTAPKTKGGRPTLSGIPEDGSEEDLWNAWEAYDNAKGV